MRWSARTLLCVGVLVAVAGCVSGWSQARPQSPYRVMIPVMKAQPTEYACEVAGEPATCVSLLASDLSELVVELYAACLALGGERAACTED